MFVALSFEPITHIDGLGRQFSWLKVSLFLVALFQKPMFFLFTIMESKVILSPYLPSLSLAGSTSHALMVLVALLQ